MSIFAKLVDGLGVLLHTETVGHHTHLIIEDHSRAASQFKTTTFTGEGTTAVVTPRIGGAIVLTDFIIGSKKFSAGSVEIRFTDGTNTESIYIADTDDVPISIAFSPAGRWRGWLDARIDVVVVGADTDPTVAIGYYHLTEGSVLSFSDWDAER